MFLHSQSLECEQAELVAALLRGTEQPDEPAGGEREGVAPVPKCDGDAGDAQVLLTFSQRARLLSAAAAGRPTLDGTGKAAAGALLAASPRVGCCGPVSELCPRRSSSLARGCARSLSSSEASSSGHLGSISGHFGPSRGCLGAVSGPSRVISIPPSPPRQASCRVRCCCGAPTGAAVCFILGAFSGTFSEPSCRLSHRESAVCVGVDEFVEDASIAAAGGGGSFDGGALAAALVPRWVLTSLGVAAGEEALVSVVALPRATWVRLQPHTDAFAASLGRDADPRQLLTQLINRFVAVSVRGSSVQRSHFLDTS